MSIKLTGSEKDAMRRVSAHMSEARTLLEELRDHYQEKFDAKDEEWQESDDGETMNEFIGLLNDTVESTEATESFADEYTQ